MTTALVTGSAGFVGRNLCTRIDSMPGLTVLPYDIGDAPVLLEEYAKKADVVVHLAGVNRPKNPADYVYGNRDFTANVLSLLRDSGRCVTFIFSSSIQVAQDNPYGMSKKAAEDLINEWSRATRNKAIIYRLPNLFGKWCRPNYNSVVATFCHNLANGLPIRVDNPDTELVLAYIDDVVAEFLRAISAEPHIGEDGFGYIPRTFRITLGALAEKIRAFSDSRHTLMIPDLSQDFDRFLYATYVSYLPETAYSLDLKKDNRGWFSEFLKSGEAGQISISRTRPGITRGNHWHHTKTEKFLVVEGEAVIRLRQVGSDEVTEIRVSGQELQPVDIPPGYTHSITNIGKTDLVTLFWASEIFDPSRPDTIYLEV
ncbi:MAG: NAD-dependent epimerase/dehydratase family protein [Bacillota bacterium]